MSGSMDRFHANKGETRAYPTAREAISTWTHCGEQLVPRLAHSGCPQSGITLPSLSGKEVFPKAV
jgi:hypothetical protein